ncbi:hypothetical protein ACO2Q1_11490 [Brevundimonas sp. VNH65]|uniref:hypothetical protein n=1 Tax=Brevundimonas sp. VNH65 TaxID=3400917 RepID=UPI003BFE97A5
MRSGAAILLVVAPIIGVGLLAADARAGAWVQPRGKGQAILKLEQMRADQGYGPSGEAVVLPAPRRDTSAGVFAEYGLTERLTLQLKGDWQQGRDFFVDYEGRGPVEVGLTWQVARTDKWAVSVYGGYAQGGEGRNAGYAAPGQGDQDWEARASVGRSFSGGDGRFAASGRFLELQTARRFRQGLPDETRIDLTWGSHYGPDWMILAQAFAGQADDDQGRPGARWLAVETSAVRRFGDWSVQAGWRSTVAGRETPVANGPVIAIWRRF